MTEITALLNDKIVWFQLILIITFFVLCVVIWQRTKSYQQQLKYYKQLMESYDGGNLEGILKQITAKQTETQKSLESVGRRLDGLEEQMPQNISKVALVRYKAFPDVGGDMSFSVAALNDNGTGFVITSIHGRSDVRVYGKAIEKYSSEHMLSDEEKDAIAKARKMAN